MAFRIAIDVRHLRDFGIGTYIRNLVRALGRVDPTNEYLLTATPDGEKELAGLPSNFHATVYNRSDYDRFDNVAYPLFLRQFRIDLCHIPLNRVPVFMSKPYVVTVHDLSTVLFSEKKDFAKTMHIYKFRRGLLRADRIVAVSDHTIRDVVNVIGVPEEKIKRIHNAPDPYFAMNTGEERDEEARKDWERQKRIILARYRIQFPFLLYAGLIRPHKNVARLVEAFAILRQDFSTHPLYSNLRLVIIGDDLGRHPQVRQAVKQSRIDGAVRFLGFVPQETMRALYEAAEVFTFPSLYEGFGLAALEAVACGTPVVASNSSSLPEALGDAAVFVNPENPFDIARGIRDLLLDEDLRGQLIQAGYRRLGTFSWERTASQTLDVYHEVITGRRRRT